MRERMIIPMATEETNNQEVTQNDEVVEDTQTQQDDVTTENQQEGEKVENADAEPTDQQKIENLNKELQEEKDKYLRLFAEFQNFRNRTIKEKTETYNNATAKCVEEILPIVDDFERALAQECTDDKYKEGMQNILKRFKNILDKLGVKEIDALGKPFDPNIHHAIQQVPSDEYESDTVCNVFQKGYMLNEKLIRPAMVQVVE